MQLASNVHRTIHDFRLTDAVLVNLIMRRQDMYKRQTCRDCGQVTYNRCDGLHMPFLALLSAREMPKPVQERSFPPIISDFRSRAMKLNCALLEGHRPQYLTHLQRLAACILMLCAPQMNI